MKINDTIIDLWLNVVINDVISKNAIYDHIFDIVFDLYEEITNDKEINQECCQKLIAICEETFEVKVNEYVDFINEGLTEDIKKNDFKLDSFMSEKVYSLIPIIKNYLIKNYEIFTK